jgi:DNA gyrase/topoisomerase IV subunit A
MARKPKKAKQVIDLSLDQIEVQNIEQVNKQEFLDYAIAVATDRAIPRFDDGLKPVQRRILYAMHQMKLDPRAKHRKAQQVEGDVMGKYHPHAGSYQSMVYLTEPFTFQLPMIDGRGSFHDISGNASAAARYTEVRMSQYGHSFVERLSKDLVAYEPNYDNTLEIPKVFPVQLPMLLINGVKTGIAVGFTSAIAPHNPVDATKLFREYLKNPKMRLQTALNILQGPDLPTGGVLIGNVEDYYATGVGKFQNEGVIIDDPEAKNGLIITEVPFNMAGSVNGFVEKVKDMIFDNKLKGIKEIDDFTGPEDIAQNKVRLEVTLQAGFDHEQAKLMLFTKTDLRQTYSLQWMALDGKTPKLFNLMSYLEGMSQFQHKLIVREFKAVKRKSKARLEIVNALITVPANLDALIHAAQNTEGKQDLMTVLQGLKTIPGQKADFDYTEKQAEALAMMRVYQLNKVDAQKMIDEKAELEATIEDANVKIKEPQARVKVLVERLTKAIRDLEKAGYGERKTVLKGAEALKSFKEQVVISDVTLTRDKYGYLKFTDRRVVNDEDVLDVIDTTDDNMLVVFTDQGNQYQLAFSKLRKYPVKSNDRGDNVVAVFADNGMKSDENVLLLTTRKQLETPGLQMFTVSRAGLAKRFETLGSKLITKTARKQVDFYKSKFDGDLLAHVSLHSDLDIATQDVLVLKGNRFKRLAFEAIKFQGSASGAGAQTFYNKGDDTPVDSVYIIDKMSFDDMQTKDHVKFNLATLPVMKETQNFQDVTNPGGGLRSSSPENASTDGASFRYLNDGTLQLFWGVPVSDVDMTDESILVGDYDTLVSSDLLVVYASGAAKVMAGSQNAVKTKRKQIDGTKVHDDDPIIYMAYVTSPYVSVSYEDEAIKTISMDQVSRQGKAGTGANTFTYSARISKIVQLAELGDLPLLNKTQKPRQVEINLF